jgi:hypothetical protein
MRTISTGEPVMVRVPFYNRVTVTDSVKVPRCYLVPQEWGFVREILAAHGVRMERLRSRVTLEVESYRFRSPRWKERPFEGRHAVTAAVEPFRERRTYGPGTIIVPADQAALRVAVQLLEPRNEDSFFAWGFFDAILEQKEYYEPEVMERMGERMLGSDSLLRAEFLRKVTADSAFAARPSARLTWLYQRSPYADQSLSVYPIGRFSGPERLDVEPLR